MSDTDIQFSDDEPDSREKPRASFLSRLIPSLARDKQENGHDRLREAIEEAMEQNAAEEDGFSTSSGSEQERMLITNILDLRDLTSLDVMIPRADIAALDIHADPDELMTLFAEQQNTRIPIYDGTLDNLIGTIHIKDYMAKLAEKKPFTLRSLIRDVPLVSPAMSALDLLLFFQENGRHMAMVVDEYGGIDGLVTIGDVIEAIVGDIEDEYDNAHDPEIQVNEDGSLLADARYDIEDFEAEYGHILTEEEREDIDTLAGLVFTLAGRVPNRGEVLTHDSGVEFEILDADPRRINRLMVRNVSALDQNAAE